MMVKNMSTQEHLLAKFILHRTIPNEDVPYGQQHDSGKLYLAIAHTQWGDIPGKAKENTCWFPYDGKEHVTENFSYVGLKNHRLLKSPRIPDHALKCGHQNDGAGELYGVIAHTQWGDIPGKAKPGMAWYCYDGKEHTTSDFSWIVQSWTLAHRKQFPEPPHTAVSVRQNDLTGEVWAAVAHTEHGDIPAKAKNQACWYSYADKEETTENFSWLSVPGYHLTQGSHPPSNAVACGHQTDGAGTLYAAIAHTHEWGEIPGKAKDNNCWYPYRGKEYTTDSLSFSWITF